MYRSIGTVAGSSDTLNVKTVPTVPLVGDADAENVSGVTATLFREKGEKALNDVWSSLMSAEQNMRFRDARQPILPQLKIAHLRAIPAPPTAAAAERLLRAAQTSSDRARGEQRRALDTLVFELYQLDADERALVTGWHDASAPRPRVSR